jgi:PAS domain S-box-containing protein
MVGGSGGSTDVRRATLEDASGVIELICEFDRRISHLSFAQVTRGALEFMADRLGVVRASVALRMNGSQGFTIFDSTLDIRGIESGRVIPPNSASLAATVQQGVPVYREDIRLWPTPNLVDDALISAGIFTTFSVPLACGSECLGTLNVGADGVDGVLPLVRQVIELVAPRLAFAIQAGLAHERTVESESQLRDIFEAVGDGIVVADISNRNIVMVNSAICRMLGRSEAELLTGTIEALHPSERFSEVMATFTRMVEGSIAHALDVPMHKDGASFNVDVTARRTILGKKPCVVGLFRDASARQQREQEQVQVQKLESIRELAAGIAHDFNNLLTGIIGNMNLAESYLEAGSDPFELLAEAQRAAFRATSLTRQLLTFAKGGTPVRKGTDICQIVRDSAELTCRGSNVQCQFEFEKSQVHVLGDEGQLAQVFQNLVRNAVEAMPRGGAVRIGITLRKSTQGSKDTEVAVTVSDHGCGIDPVKLDRIFLPFYTTKARGSGLGLAVTYSVVQSHAGRISVISDLGKGTTFEVVLPIVDSADSDAISVVRSAVRGSGRVLVMDDQAVIRQVAGRALRRAGYETCLVANGEDAILAYREALQRGERFDVTILDLTVSDGMGGRETAAALLAIDPTASLIVSSGYSEDGVMSEHTKHGFMSVLPKPYGAFQLVDAVAALVKSQ